MQPSPPFGAAQPFGPSSSLHGPPLAGAQYPPPLSAPIASTSTAQAGVHAADQGSTSGGLQASTSSTGAVTRTVARPRRSKKVRPCDLCRRRKGRCVIEAGQEACINCTQIGKSCTFALPPITRPIKQTLPSTDASSLNPQPHPPTASIAVPTYTPSNAPPSAPQPSPSARPLVPPLQAATTLASLSQSPFSTSNHLDPQDSSRPSSSGSSGGRVTRPPTASVASLDQGLPADWEPSAVTTTLTDDLFSHNTVSQSRQISSNQDRSMFIVFNHRPPNRVDRTDADLASLKRTQRFIAAAAPTLILDRLVHHYLASIHPAFPILPVSASFTLDSLPPALQTLILATAFATLPEYALASRTLWISLKEERLADHSLDLPRLSSLAAALLELSTTLDARGDYGLLAKTIAHAQLLGLHIDCQEWAIPGWEKSLRERIWWCLRIHDAWSSFLNSRPSHIQAGNYNTRMLPPPAPQNGPDNYTGALSFHYLCRLSTVVGRLQSQVSILDSYGTRGRVQSCDRLEGELHGFKAEVAGQFAIAGRESGMDCFLFLLLGLRAMIRRISIEVQIGLGNSFAPDGDTLAIFNDAVSFVESLGPQSFAGDKFWLSYSAHVMSSLVSSLIRLSLATVTFSPTVPIPSAASSRTVTPARLLGRLHRALFAARHHSNWAVADWALQRAHKVAAQLRLVGASETGGNTYEEVIRALESTSADDVGPSPAAPVAATPRVHAAGLGVAETGFGAGPGSPQQLADVDAWLNVLDGTAVWGDFEEDYGMGLGNEGGLDLGGGESGFQWGW